MSEPAIGRRIIELRAENFKRLRAVSIATGGRSVVIGGRNGQGKSSTLDAIWAALGGAKGAPKDPVRRGEELSKICVDLGDLVVTRVFRPGGGTKLEVATREGAVMKSPQAVLDRLVGELSFDPLAFARMPAKEQAEVLRRLAGIDLADLDKRIHEAFTERTVANRQAKQAEASHAALGARPEPVERVDVSELTRELAEVGEHNDRWREAGRKHNDARAALHAARREVAELELRLAEAQEQKLAAEAALAATPEPGHRRDPEPIMAKMAAADATNRQAEALDRWVASEAGVSKHRAAAESLDEKVAALRAERDEAIRSATYPIDGLLVTDDGVTYQGVPLSQASQAEQIRISSAIGMALNPSLKVLLIRDGSLLDEDSLAALLKQADAAGCQLWVERVGRGGVGVVIEDGEVVDA